MNELVSPLKDPLMQPVQYAGQAYLSSQYFHRQYREKVGLQGKYRQHKDFLRLLRSMPLYTLLIEHGDIVEIAWTRVKSEAAHDLRQWQPLFQATGYQPLTLINITAQGELTHHLEDELSQQMAYAANVMMARHGTQHNGVEAIPVEAQRALDMHRFAAELIETDKRLDALFGIPEYITLTESVKTIKASIGLDLSPKLLLSPKMDDIPYTDVFLEIRELQARFGLKNGTLNPLIAKHRWQKKTGDGWEATNAAQQHGYCIRHAWTNGTKSGINWKWRVAFIENLLKEEGGVHAK